MDPPKCTRNRYKIKVSEGVVRGEGVAILFEEFHAMFNFWKLEIYRNAIKYLENLTSYYVKNVTGFYADMM